MWEYFGTLFLSGIAASLGFILGVITEREKQKEKEKKDERTEKDKLE